MENLDIDKILYFLSSSSDSDEEEELLYTMFARENEVPKIKHFIQEVVYKFKEHEVSIYFLKPLGFYCIVLVYFYYFILFFSFKATFALKEVPRMSS